MALTRRAFAGSAAAHVLVRSAQAPKPNILWITCEDTGPQIGCYGDKYANTPNIDKLASQGVRYSHAWSTAPVCAPARTTIISGMYPPSTGSEHMRSMARLPAGMNMYPCYLREAGYYVSNNSKEDYNLEYTGKVWDDSSAKAHWRNRQPGQPFFSIFNFLTTHESQIRKRPHTLVHDPAGVRVPAYHPDTPEVRHDWAQTYDNITTMDGQAGSVLKQLESDGLLDDTIVFFYGDHGSGMPRSKRWPYNSGLQVPLIAHFPDKFRHLATPDYKVGGISDRLVGFVDLAPTVLSLAGVRPPSHMQGHAFLGQYPAAPQPYQFGFRGRMDERYDLVRSVRDHRYIYIRNYMPHEIYGQHIAYMFETPTTAVWKRMYDEGKLTPVQKRFWEQKPPEELYDLQNDPDEVNNLAASAQHQSIRQRMSKAQVDLAVKIRDVGFLPEDEIHSRSKGSTPYEMGHDPQKYPVERVIATAGKASMGKPEAVKDLLAALEDKDSGVRYWGALGLLMRGEKTVLSAKPQLEKAMKDPAPAVRIVAAEALGRFGNEEDLKQSLATLLQLAPADTNGAFVAIEALNAIDALGAKADSLKPKLREIATKDPNVGPRPNDYAFRLRDYIVSK